MLRSIDYYPATDRRRQKYTIHENNVHNSTQHYSAVLEILISILLLEVQKEGEHSGIVYTAHTVIILLWF